MKVYELSELPAHLNDHNRWTKAVYLVRGSSCVDFQNKEVIINAYGHSKEEAEERASLIVGLLKAHNPY